MAIDLRPTAEMAAAAKKGLRLREEHGRGGTAVGVARARDISGRRNLSPRTVGRMVNYFARHNSDRDAPGFGIMHSDDECRIYEFVEKPRDPAILDPLRIGRALLEKLGKPADAELYQASMGIYIFNRQALVDALDNQYVDFGKHVIPEQIHKAKVSAYIFEGYW
jgi:NDP-sugar pyrophosphorylase family protein